MDKKNEKQDESRKKSTDSKRGSVSNKSDANSEGGNLTGEGSTHTVEDVETAQSQPTSSQQQKHKEGKESLKSNDPLDFKETNSDNWDVDLIPKELIDRVYAEMLLGSDGEMEEVESVAVVEEEEEESGDQLEKFIKPRFSMPNISGAIPKKTLKFMTRRQLRALIHKTRSDICYLKTETTVLKKARDKMEKREKEIDSYVPFEYEAHWTESEMGKGDVCDTTSAEESDPEADMTPVNAKDLVHFSTDKIYENMSDKTKVTVRKYIENLGEIAPDNFDVMRYKYGKLTKYGKAERLKSDTDKNSSMPTSTATTETEDDIIMSDPKKALEAAINDERNAKILFAEESKIDPEADPEYPGFKPSKAKKLAINDKLKYALQQEELMRKEFIDSETELMIAKYRLQVHVDMNMDSVKLLMRLLKGLENMRASAIHPLTGKLMGEKVAGYRSFIKRAILAEETTTTLNTIHLDKIMKKIKMKLKINRNMGGEKIGFIDFEELRITNLRMLEDVAGKNQEINELKIVETSVCRTLKEAQQILMTVTRDQKKTAEEINRRNSLLISFYNDFLRYQAKLQDVIKRSNFLKRMHSNTVSTSPDTLQYIRLKSDEYKLQDSVKNFKQKIRNIRGHLVKARKEFTKNEKKLPAGILFEKESDDWMDEIKKEVEDNGLLHLLDDEDIRVGTELMNDRKMNLGISGLPISHKGNSSKLPQMTAILLASGKTKRKKSSVIPKYDIEETGAPVPIAQSHLSGNETPKTFDFKF